MLLLLTNFCSPEQIYPMPKKRTLSAKKSDTHLKLVSFQVNGHLKNDDNSDTIFWLNTSCFILLRSSMAEKPIALLLYPISFGNHLFNSSTKIRSPAHI